MKTRILHTQFWKDEYIGTLTPSEKLLFLYFITNECVSIIHLYKISERQVLFDTGIDKATILKAKRKFVTDGKIFFYKDYVFLRNANRYERYIGEKNEAAKQREVANLSSDVLDWYNKLLDTPMDTPIYTPSIPPINQRYIDNKGVIGGKEGITSKTGRVACTDEEMMLIAQDLGVTLHDVEETHAAIIDKIDAGEFKDKTVYYTLRSWIRYRLDKGSIKRKAQKGRSVLFPDATPI